MKAITCIVCPNGCRITCEKRNGEYLISGNSCRRGEEYALSEMTEPMRTLTTTVRTSFLNAPALPVRTSAPIPKAHMMDVMRELAHMCVDTPLAIGDIVVPQVCGLDSDIICTSNILLDTERR